MLVVEGGVELIILIITMRYRLANLQAGMIECLLGCVKMDTGCVI